MSTITFTTLECIRKQDVTGKDEPHLIVDGVDLWDGVLDKGDTEPVGRSKNFDGSMTVTLKEKNPNSWKTIGTVTITTGRVAPAVFKTSGAHYQLWYTIKG